MRREDVAAAFAAQVARFAQTQSEAVELDLPLQFVQAHRVLKSSQ